MDSLLVGLLLCFTVSFFMLFVFPMLRFHETKYKVTYYTDTGEIIKCWENVTAVSFTDSAVSFYSEDEKQVKISGKFIIEEVKRALSKSCSLTDIQKS